MHVHPTREQIDAVARGDLEAPVVMLNLLRFKDDAGDGRTGEEAYRSYGERFGAMQERYGPEVVWIGRPWATVIGPSEEHWDLVILVRYPSLRAFVEMGRDPDYLEIAGDRTAAVADSRLVAMSEGGPVG